MADPAVPRPPVKDAPRAEFRPIELFVPEIRQLVERRAYEELQSLLMEINPIDLADGFTLFSPEHQLLLFRLLDPRRGMAVFEELDLPEQQNIIEHMEDQTLQPFLQDIPNELAAKLFCKLPTRMVRRMTGFLRNEAIQTVEDILEYPENSVGRIMRTRFIHVDPDVTATATLTLLQARSKVRHEVEFHMVYVTNGNRRLLGGVTLRQLIAAPHEMKMRDLMTPLSPIRIPVTMDREEAAEIFSRYKTITAPVVDGNNRLVGVLDADDVIRVLEQETTEDIQKLAGVEAFDTPYFETPFLEMVKKRGSWLCVLFLGEMLTATAMAFFEQQIARAVVLALFIPLIISSGGNSGSQASTLIVRALALKDVTFRDWWRVMQREIFSGLALGCILGSIGFLRIYIWSQFSHVYGPHYMLVALSVALSLVLVVMWGSLAGSILPIVLRRLGFDPAVVSAPFVATLVDVTGLVIYFSVAMTVLHGTLL